jgi:hypothetical protein
MGTTSLSFIRAFLLIDRRWRALRSVGFANSNYTKRSSERAPTPITDSSHIVSGTQPVTSHMF